MAQTTERLEAKFAETGLKKLRRKMAGLAGDAEAIGDAMEASEKQFSSAVDQMEKDTKRLQKVVEAQSKAFEAAMSGSAKEAEAVSTALEKAQKNAKALDSQGVSVGISGGGGGGNSGAIGAVLSGGANLAQLAFFVSQLRDAKEAVAETAEAVNNVSNLIQGFNRGFRDAGDTANAMADGLDSAEEGMQRLSRRAERTTDKVRDLLRQMKEYGSGEGMASRVAPGALETSSQPYPPLAQDTFRGMSDDELRGVFDSNPLTSNRFARFDGFEDMGRSARKAADGVSDVTEEAKDFIGMGKKLGKKVAELGEGYDGLKSQALKFATSMKSVKGVMATVLVATAALIPKYAQLAREMTAAGAKASALPSDIQKLANSMQLLTGRFDADAAGEVLKEFDLRLQESIEGTGEAREAYDRLGISMQELGQMSRFDAMQRVNKELRQMSPRLRNATGELVYGGEAWDRYAANVMHANEEIARAAEDNAFADEQIAGFQMLATQVSSIMQRFKKLGGELLGIFQPVFQAILGLTDHLLRGITAVFDKLEDGVRFLFKQIRRVDEYLTGMSGKPMFDYDGMNDAGDPQLETAAGQVRKAAEQYSKAQEMLDDDLERGLIGQGEYDKRAAQLLKTYFEEVRKIDKQFKSIDLSGLVDDLAAAYKQAKTKLENGEPIQAAIEIEYQEPGHAGAELQDVDMPDMGTSILPLLDFSKMGMSQIRALAPSLKEVDTVIGSLQDQYESATSQAQRQRLQAMIQKVKAYKREMEGATAETKSLADTIEQNLGRSLGQGLNQIISVGFDQLFGSAAGNLDQLRLQQYSLQEQERQLNESLRRREISQREYRLRVGALNSQMLAQQQQIAKANGGIASSFKTLSEAVGSVMKKVLADIATMITRLLVAKALISAFNLSSGGFGGALIQGLGGGGLMKTATSSAMAGSKTQQAQVTHVFEGQWELDGRSFKTGMDQTDAYDTRNGR